MGVSASLRIFDVFAIAVASCDDELVRVVRCES